MGDKKCIVFDLDGTICENKKNNESYEDLKPNSRILNKLREYKEKGYYIIIYTSRNMKTFKCNIGKINAVTLKIILDWLDRYKVPYDEIFVGKPWCGKGFYVDDKTIRPSEFLNKSEDEIYEIIEEK